MMLEADERRSLRGAAAEADLNNDNVITVDELVAHLSSRRIAAATAPTGNDVDADDDSGSASRPAAMVSDRRDRRSGNRLERATARARQRVYTGSAGEAQAKRRQARIRIASRQPTERLPAGLPSWFKSRDKNGDGQVAMSEYSRTWSKQQVAEFRSYDANDDGIITPKEVAEVAGS